MNFSAKKFAQCAEHADFCRGAYEDIGQQT
nr:MAG TPA: hypothetical protein [Caudoviricetes sp.]